VAADDEVAPTGAFTVHFQEPVTLRTMAFRLECPRRKPRSPSPPAPEPPGDGGSFLLRPAKSCRRERRCTLRSLRPRCGEERFGQAMAEDFASSFKGGAWNKKAADLPLHFRIFISGARLPRRHP